MMESDSGRHDATACGAGECDVGASGTLAEGAMRAVTIGDRPLLLARVDGVCHAVGARCPHAGGKLEEGVLCDGIVTCPWHKARFRLADGALIDPPALEGLKRHDVREQDGRILVSAAPLAPDGRPDGRPGDGPARGRDARCMAIIGAGAAGAAAAQTLREQGFAGRVVMIDRAGGLPYDRTVLSKFALADAQGDAESPLHDAGFYAAHGIERMTARVTGIDPAARRIRFEDAAPLGYDAALVATGGTPRRLQVPGAGLRGVFVLRSVAHAQAIAAAAAGTRHVVIAGAGFIAMEAAACLRGLGCEVAVVAPERVPLERQLGAAVGGAVRDLHARHGTALHLGDTVAAIEGETAVERVRLRSGAVLPAGLVLAGLGVRPETGLLAGLEGAGVRLDADGGVIADRYLKAADGLFVAGDIAAVPLAPGAVPVRIEHWRVAQQHGRLAARNMLGAAEPNLAVPYFWTTHFGRRLDYTGHAGAWDTVVVDGDPAGDFVAWYVGDGRVRAAAGWGRDRQMAGVLARLGERRAWTAEALRAATQGLRG